MSVKAAATSRPTEARPLAGRTILLFVLCTVVTLDAIGYAAAGGPQNIIWLLVFTLAFGVPFAMVVAELGAAIPAEGGIYHWIKAAYGRAIAGIATFFYWVSAPVWVGGVLAAVTIAVVDEFLVPLTRPTGILVGLIFVATAVACSRAPLTTSTAVSNLGGILRIAVVGIFTTALVVYAARRGVPPPTWSDFRPTFVGFLSAVPVLYFILYGFETPSAAADGIPDTRTDLPRNIRRGLGVVVALYSIPIVGTLLIVPTDQLSSVTGFIDAMKIVFTAFGGHVLADGHVVLSGVGQALAVITAVGFIGSLVTAAATWLLASNHVLAAAAHDGALHRGLARRDPDNGSPTTATALGGVIALLAFVSADALTQGDLAKYFSAGIALTISTTAIAYAVMFPAYLRLLRDSDRAWPFRMPGGPHLRRLCGALGTLWSLAALIMLIYPGSGVQLVGEDADAYLPEGFAGERLEYTMFQVGALLGLGLAAIILRRSRRASSP